ncbi:MAG: S1 RNA-binding domain-containing protein, partial [Anaerolineae bacterium]|nr:S1 RNA-binding domain-containing protein [Anaerolineae bacterium]
RETHGAFASRKALHDVSGLGAKAFEQSAGFLRVRDGENLLDMTAIHPESYAVAQAVLVQAAFTPDAPMDVRETAIAALLETRTIEVLAGQLGAGIPTVQDILEQLVRPGRDPREDSPLPILRSDVLSMDDLQEGMRLNGTVRNVVDFGAFVDIGVKQDGLLHRSQIPFGVQLTVGEIIEVAVLNVDLERGRIQLGWGKES